MLRVFDRRGGFALADHPDDAQGEKNDKDQQKLVESAFLSLGFARDFQHFILFHAHPGFLRYGEWLICLSTRLFLI
jgi:hypothetical protein